MMTHILGVALIVLMVAAVAREWEASKSRGIAMSVVVALPLLAALIWAVSQ